MNTEVLMLILSRRIGESFFIGDDIEIRILRCGSTVQVGINAPPHIEIVRAELIPENELEEVID